MQGATQTAHLAGGHPLLLPHPVPPGPLTIGIRPEHLTPDPAGLPLTIDLVEPLGSETLIHAHLPDGTPLLIKQPGALPITDTITVSLPPTALHLFTPTGHRLPNSP